MLGGLLIDGASTGRGRLSLGQLIVGGAVDRLLEDGVRLVDLELGLEILNVVEAGGVGSATGVGEVELVVQDLLARITPVIA